ncbi:MAG: MFS transporter, partial [Rhodoferax sp.]|nr:MFS transporter [Rhodoferax sp.]
MPSRLLRRFGLIPGRPGVQAFAFIASFEAVVRGVSLSIYPLLMYRAWSDAATVSKIYFVVGLVSLMTALSVPMVARHLARRWVYSVGVGLYLLSALFGMLGGHYTALALASNAMATATVFVCFNAYVLDNVPKSEFSRLETLRLFYGGVGWTIGPVLGVWLLRIWPGAPFIVVGLASALMLVTFWA